MGWQPTATGDAGFSFTCQGYAPGDGEGTPLGEFQLPANMVGRPIVMLTLYAMRSGGSNIDTYELGSAPSGDAWPPVPVPFTPTGLGTPTLTHGTFSVGIIDDPYQQMSAHVETSDPFDSVLVQASVFVIAGQAGALPDPLPVPAPPLALEYEPDPAGTGLLPVAGAEWTAFLATVPDPLVVTYAADQATPPADPAALEYDEDEPAPAEFLVSRTVATSTVYGTLTFYRWCSDDPAVDGVVWGRTAPGVGSLQWLEAAFQVAQPVLP